MKRTRLTQQEKTATEVQGTKVAETIKNGLVYLVAVLVAVTFLIHMFLPITPSGLQGVKQEKNAKSDEIDSYIEEALKNDVSYLQLQKEYDLIKDRYSKQKLDFYVSGFPSWHKFTWHFGVGLIIVVMSVYVLTTVNLYSGARKKSIAFMAFLFLTCGGYYMAWIFFPYDDLPHKIYFPLLVFMALLGATSAMFINRIKFMSISKLKGIIRMTMDRLLDGKGYARNEGEYTKKILEPTIKDLHERTR